jgi:DivIVA domain-containing protein
MALDRQSIEKRDFPIGRRGYDPAAVDAHLAEIAAEVEELKLSASRRRNDTLASTASDQVRAILEAAEASAAEIVSQAETEARELRTEAAQEAQGTRSDATTQARDYVGRVSESTGVMLQRLNAMDSELAALIDGLRTGSNRLNADLQLLESNFDEVRDATEPVAPPSPAPATAAPASASSPQVDEVEAETVVEAEFEPASSLASSLKDEPANRAPDTVATVDIASAPDPLDELEEAVTAEPAAQVPPPVVSPPSEADELESARLVALNMALNGTSRAETARYLSINFALDDREQLLDDVYSSVES